MIVIADQTKVVQRLGAFALPVEVNVFGLGATQRLVAQALTKAGCAGGIALRKGADGAPFVTDGQHFILDCALGSIPDARRLRRSCLPCRVLWKRDSSSAFAAGPLLRLRTGLKNWHFLITLRVGGAPLAGAPVSTEQDRERLGRRRDRHWKTRAMNMFRTSRFAATLAALLTVAALAPLAHAQDANAPTNAVTPAAEQPAPPAADQPALSPSHLAAAREVVTLSGMTDSLLNVIPQVLNKTHLSIARQRPELAKELEEASNAVLLQLVPQRDEIIAIAATTFARGMTEADLVAIATFLKSGPGKTYIEKQRLLVQEIVLSMRPWTDQLNRTVLTLFREELKKKGITI